MDSPVAGAGAGGQVFQGANQGAEAEGLVAGIVPAARVVRGAGSGVAVGTGGPGTGGPGAVEHQILPAAGVRAGGQLHPFDFGAALLAAGAGGGGTGGVGTTRAGAGGIGAGARAGARLRTALGGVGAGAAAGVAGRAGFPHAAKDRGAAAVEIGAIVAHLEGSEDLVLFVKQHCER